LVSDVLFEGWLIRSLTVVENFSRQSLAIEVGQGVSTEQVVGVMNGIAAERGVSENEWGDNTTGRTLTLQTQLSNMVTARE
jgi:putative transposase